ncbi:ATP-grasp domain-containing protein [Hugenholtzia roseola]|uniref:ATP-grasp domain-containing protein n=1 Tax=Hugenholtzia roseola TaxID=1002 RepID=UPI00040ABC8C|nr:ATP-grasp domain-containing protein [Hugenholtzia roseola]
MKKILVIGAGWEQYALLETIKEAGYGIVATHPHLRADGFKLAEHFYVKDAHDIAAHLRIATSHGVVGIITDNCDYSFYTAAVIANKLGLPFANIASAIFSNDKYAQRERCKNTEVYQPQYAKVRTPEDLAQAASSIGFPLILKPTDSRGTFGVTIARHEQALYDAYYEALHYSPSHTLICEKFIEGTLVTVDGFCFKNGHNALAVASRKFERGAKPVTKEIIYPAQFSADLNTRLLSNHERVVELLGYTYGHTHGEYIVTKEEEIYLVECTNRGGGVYTSSVIVPMLTQIDLNKILLHQSLGIDDFEVPKLGLAFMKKSILLTFLDFQVGKVLKSINVEEMLAKEYTLRYRTIYGENDMVESIENCASRHSMLVLQGANAEETLRNFENFKNDLKIEYYK